MGAKLGGVYYEGGPASVVVGVLVCVVVSCGNNLAYGMAVVARA
jgi:hypothetical protein